jgi:hypothetical protein
MRAVQKIERKADPVALTSFAPLEGHGKNRGADIGNNEKLGEYFPCHYFGELKH